MPVRVTKTCRVAYQSNVVDLTDGDELADGEFVDYLLATHAPVEPIDHVEPGRPPGNASVQAWSAYVLTLGATDEQVDGLSRNNLRDLADELEAAHDATGDTE